MKVTLITILIPAIFTLIGVGLGNYLNYVNSYKLYKKQRIYENQRLSYSKLLSLKNPWTQSYRTHLEAKLLAEFYDCRFQLFTHDINDLNEGKKQYDRALDLIKDISNIQREIFETLGLIQTCFKMTPELQQAIDDLYNYNTVDIAPFDKNFESMQHLQAIYDQQTQNIEPALKREYKDKIEEIATLLKPLLIDQP